MSIIASVYLKEGIIMSADSRKLQVLPHILMGQKIGIH